MKISSASKKVLASALSAAMVVAFAPTVAFAGNGTKVDVTLDLNGGTVESGYTTFPTAEQTDVITLPTVKGANGVYANVWKYDDNKDGVIDGKDTAITNGQLTLATGFTAITVKAFYEQPELGDVTVNSSTGMPTVAVKGAEDIAINGYKLDLMDATGKVVVENKNIGNIGAGKSTNVLFTGIGTSSKYTVSLKNAKGDEIAYKSVDVCKVTLSNAASSIVYAVKGQPISLTGAYKDADNNIYYGSYTPSKDVTLTEVAANYAGISSYDEDSRAFTIAGKTGNTAGATYALSVVDPDGNTIYNAAATADSSISSTVSFKADSAGAKFTASEKAGTYKAVLSETVKGGSATDTVNTFTTEFKLSKVEVSAGDGAFKADSASSAAIEGKTAYFTDATTLAVPTIQAYLEAPEGKEFKEWQVNGTEAKATTALTAGAVNTVTAVYKDKAAATTPSAPTVKATKSNNKWDIELASATTGVKVFYTTDGSNPTSSSTEYKKAFTVDPGTTVKAVAIAEVGQSDKKGSSKIATFTEGSFASFKKLVAGSQSDLELYVGKTGVKYKAQDSIKAAADAGLAQIDAIGFATAEDWTKAEVSSSKAVFEATAAFAKAELAKYENEAYVAVGAKVYTVKAADLKKAVDDIAAAEAYIAKNADVAGYAAGVKTVVTATNKALNGATDTKLAAADVEAAAAVTAQLQAAKTGDEAKAALEAYSKLTDDQKKLVAAADVAAAQKVVSNDENAKALVEAQDEAAIAAVKGKTVKAKAKKKTTASLKAVTSKSGAKSTFAKTSGNAKIKVSAAGKITVKKGLKAGKTYRAKVKATVGTQTKTVTVIVKVAK